MRKLIVSIHSTANDIVTGPPSDETNFMVWAQAGIEDSLESFPKSLGRLCFTWSIVNKVRIKNDRENKTGDE